MQTIVTPQEAIELVEIKNKKKKNIVIVGGCFDILHPGHIAFLAAAKEKGEILIILLEADEAVRQTKGPNRPINTQKTRAKLLQENFPSSIIVLLPYPFIDKDYDKFVTSIKPAIIATTKGDPYIYHKLRQAKLIGAKVEEVIARMPDHSTSDIISTSV